MLAKDLRRKDVLSYQGNRYYAITDAHRDGSVMIRRNREDGSVEKKILEGREEVELLRKGRLNNRK